MKTSHKSHSMKKNLRQCLNRLLATFVILLAALPSSAARSYVFALTDSETESQFSPQKYYYGNYEKAEPTRATVRYAKVTTAPSDWSGIYLLAGQYGSAANPTTAWFFTGNAFSSTATDGAVSKTVSDGVVEAPSGVVDVKLEYILTSSDNNVWYCISYIKPADGKRYYLGNNTTPVTRKPTDTDDPDNDKPYLWRLAPRSGTSFSNYGSIDIINRANSSAKIQFRYQSSYRAFASYTGSSTNNYCSSSYYYCLAKLYKKLIKVSVSETITNGTVTVDKEYASPGETVTIYTHPDPGYATTEVSTSPSLTVTGDVSSTYMFTFIMPDEPVEVSATFGTGASSVYHTIACEPSSENPSDVGYITANTNTAAPGTIITITPTSDPNYLLTSLTYTPEGGSAVAVDITTKQFSMPGANVTVTADFTEKYIKVTDRDEDDWAGRYIVGFSGENGAYGGISLSSGHISGTPITLDNDTILLKGSSRIYDIEYGGIMSGLTGASEVFNGKPYYHIYYYDANGVRKYWRVTGSNSMDEVTATTIASSASNNHKWMFYENSSDQFQFKNFSGAGYFLYAINTTSSHWITTVVNGDAVEGYAPTGTSCYVYLYRWNAEHTIETNIVGDGTVDLGGKCISTDNSGYIAYPNETVTFTPTPGAGYNFSSISVVDEDGNQVAVTSTNTGIYQFDMPSKNVTIKAFFASSDCAEEGDYNVLPANNPSTVATVVANGNDPCHAKFPYSPYHSHSYKQIVYSDPDIPGVITSIGFMYYLNNTSLDIETKNNVSVYLGDTEANSLTEWVDIEDLTKVYEGPMNFIHPDNNAWHWQDFTFNENGGKFKHNQSKNLIIAIHDHSANSSLSQTSRGFFYATSTENVELYNATGTTSGSSGFSFDSNGKPTYTSSGNAVTANISKNYPITRFCGVPSYTVTCDDDIDHGSLSATPNNKVTLGDWITITATPDDGYVVGTITATNESTGTTIAVSGSGNVRTFTMPAADVTVTATFVESGGGGDTWVDNVTSQPAGYVVDGSGNVTISSAEGLAWLISVVNGLNDETADNLSGKTVTLAADIDMNANIWVPIGTAEHPFSGIFNGGNHTISGLHISNADEATSAGSPANTGLFGSTASGATVKNFYVKDANFYASTGSLGGVVGTNAGTVQNCYSDAALSGTATAGGLVGTNNGTLSHSYTMVTSGATGSNSGTVTNSYYKAATNNSPATGEFTAAVAYTYGDYTTNNAVSNGTTTKPLVDWLNTSNPDATVKWMRTKGSSTINGGYPVLVNASSDTIMAVVGVSGDNNVYCGNANEMLTTYGANGDADIYIYSNGTITVAPSAAHLFIDENAAIKQGGAIASTAITATVGITFDNTATADGNPRDYHMFATPLMNAPLGITYSGNVGYDAGDAAVYAAMSFNTNGYFPSGIVATEVDFYDFSEPHYHWINLKRSPTSHFHEDLVGGIHANIPYDDNDGKLAVGNGYLLAIGTTGDNINTTKQVYLSATGTLTKVDTAVAVTKQGAHLTGYNYLGNPYQGYLDFTTFAETNKNVLWNGNDNYKAYLIYDPMIGGFNECLIAGESGVSFSQGSAHNASPYIHPHQAFFVVKIKNDPVSPNPPDSVKFTKAMRVTDRTSSFRNETPHYPLVNLFCTDDEGKKEISVIEVERPTAAGSLKMKDLLCGKGNMYIRWNGEDFGSMFIEGTPEYIPVWFKASEESIFTMSWSTANDNFGYLHLIDNLTGNDIDMLAAESYVFQSKPSDSKARFRLVFKPLGIEEETSTEAGENFAFINGNELVVNGEGELSLIDLNGRVLTTEHMSGQQNHIAMPKVAAGMYMLRLANAEGVKVQKIVIRK